MILKIKVTKDCIMNGVQYDGDRCPIALAVKDIFPNVFVDGEGIYPRCPGQLFYRTDDWGIKHRNPPIPIPEDIKEFIEWFDDKTTYRGCIPEFEFEIEIPEEYIARIDTEEIKPLLLNHRNLEIVY